MGFVFSLMCIFSISIRYNGKCWARLATCNLVSTLAQLMLPFWVVWMSVIRLTHGGKVISNDYETMGEQTDQSYMPISGRFIYIWLIV